MPMYLHSLTLTNVRQFDQRTFKLQPGFNLLVGENGAGKTTILRGIFAALGSTRQMGRRPRLVDNDVRLKTDLAKISAVVRHTKGEFEEFHLRKSLWRPAVRSSNRANSPLILLYSSNEATCSAMKAKPEKQMGDSYNESIRRNEEFLYASERDLSSGAAVSATESPFGNSQPVREFVKKVLITFSPDMGDFFWRFEPYACSLVSDENTPEMQPLATELKRQALAYAMRWFSENLTQKENTIDWPDQSKVILTPKESERERGERRLPDTSSIWKYMRIDSDVKDFLQSCSLEVSLTPRIRIKRATGTFNLNQLSDGEQRLFSLFVDIARQLSINNHHGKIRQSDAIVLIDEIDVHLHPKWQRRIVPALEDLFPKCQFIATTHSPFVIQATRRQQIIAIEKNFSTRDMSGGNSIEDIVEDIQGISVPQRSLRAEKLNIAAKHYFQLLELKAASPREVSAAKLHAAERTYREASEPFTSDPAVHALLNVMTMEGSR